jgi:hypothetical protein
MSFMRKSSQRKFFLFGRYSLAILPPKKWLSELEVKAGKACVMELDRKKKRIIMHLDASKEKETKYLPSKTSDKDDWEPIPPLKP